jgi:hypothetical protein
MRGEAEGRIHPFLSAATQVKRYFIRRFLRSAQDTIVAVEAAGVSLLRDPRHAVVTSDTRSGGNPILSNGRTATMIPFDLATTTADAPAT